MRKFLLAFSGLLFASTFLLAEPKTPPKANPVMPYGKIDKEDLLLTSCDFEKDANAEVLFEKGDLYYDDNFNIIIEVHRRIKIFNDNGKNQANIKIDYDGGNRFESITSLQAQTINLNNDKIEMTKVDAKQIFSQVIDKVQNQMVFSFPNVKPGSVLEYKYKRIINNFSYIPDWFFQDEIPTRYSEFDTAIPEFFYFKRQTRVFQPFVKQVNSNAARNIGGKPFNDDVQQLALSNIPSLRSEPYMTSNYDNLQKITYQLAVIKPESGIIRTFSDSWAKIATNLAEDEDLGGQLKRKLNNEEVILGHAKALKTDDEKMNYIFNEVKNTVKWNGVNHWYTSDGTRMAWDKKIGNSAEVNIILYHLLKQAGIKVLPMAVSTRSHGRVISFYPTSRQFNSTVVYHPIDSTHYYIMDATNKYNIYNEIPDNLLNNYGLCVDKSEDKYDLIHIEKFTPSRKSILINAEITKDGKMNGDATISNYSYHRIGALNSFQSLGEKKYIEDLSDHDNNLKISDLKQENIAIDTLPLTQSIKFKMDLPGSEENYIIFNSNLFMAMHKNEFLSEERTSNIDFGYRDQTLLTGNYKIPQGYKVDAMPKSISLTTPDKSIIFKRFAAEQDGAITVRYVITHAQTEYTATDYPALREFYKKMHEMLDEQIILKKS